MLDSLVEENLSVEAAKFYYDNRYASFQECVDPCKTMDVSTNYLVKKLLWYLIFDIHDYFF